MRITAARYENGELHLKCDPREGLRFVYDFKDGDWDLRKAKTKRSLNANSYAWELIHQIALKLRMDPIEVYRNAIRHTPGTLAFTGTYREEDAPVIIRKWEEDHIGRQAWQIPNGTPGYTDVMLIFGSSDYDTRTMSAFIDLLIQDAQALEIETKDPADVESLLRKWDT